VLKVDGDFGPKTHAGVGESRNATDVKNQR